MARISTRCEFSNYIFKRLGSPLVDVFMECYQNGSIGCGCPSNCSSPATTGYCITGSDTVASTGTPGTTGTPNIFYKVKTQCDYVIDDTLDYFKEFGSDLGSYDGGLFLQLQQGVNNYLMPENILTVRQPFSRSVGGGVGIGYNFDSEEAQASVGLFSFASTFGNRGIYSFLGGGTYDNLLTAEIAFEYMSLVDMRYVKKFQFTFNRLARLLTVWPTPSAADDGKIIACVVTQTVPDEYLYNSLFCQRYAVALAKIQIGMNTGLFTGAQFPGGATFNHEFFYNEGKEEREKLEKELRDGTWGTPVAGGIFMQG